MVHQRVPLRLLWMGEASYLATGFSTYSWEILNRLHQTGKYDILEVGSYGPFRDPREAQIPWKYISNSPDPNNKEEIDLYNSDPVNQFGKWRFEEAARLHKAQCVIDNRDYWYVNYQEISPFRPFFKRVWMSTVDAEPQNEEWIELAVTSDAVVTYSDWAIDVWKKQGRGKINVLGSATGGADLKNFYPLPDKRAFRKSIGVDEDCFLVGFVSRNQRRKLFPDLFQAFRKFLEQAPKSIAKKSYLLCHTGFPDVGWDIPKLLNEANIASRVLFTYHCKGCGSVYPGFYQDVTSFCHNCGRQTATLVTSNLGVSREVLGKIYNLLDIYVQYANSEGLGYGALEAAACGVPVMAVDYSAMSDVVRKLQGIPLAVKALAKEPETGCYRAVPDNDDFVEKLLSFALLPEPLKKKKGMLARQAVEEHYTWDQAAKVWMDYLDSVTPLPDQQTWLSPPRFHQSNQNVPQGLSHEDFVKWGLIHVAGRPDLLNSYLALRLSRDLGYGVSSPGYGGSYYSESSFLSEQRRVFPFDRNHAMELFRNLNHQLNYWEHRRVNG
jgi:glycosyltransferase involved in cell wall biosynthesis